jgi:hypothetical protein
VGELWDAHAGAEVRERKSKSDKETSETIYKLRVAIEETASFERARSPAGALFQVALAEDAAKALHEKFPEGDKAADRMFERLERLLDSVALVLRDACTVEEYSAVKDVVGIYISIDESYKNRSFQWRDEIPEFAKEYRRSKEAKPAAV